MVMRLLFQSVRRGSHCQGVCLACMFFTLKSASTSYNRQIMLAKMCALEVLNGNTPTDQIQKRVLHFEQGCRIEDGDIQCNTSLLVLFTAQLQPQNLEGIVLYILQACQIHHVMRKYFLFYECAISFIEQTRNVVFSKINRKNK